MITMTGGGLRLDESGKFLYCYFKLLTPLGERYRVARLAELAYLPQNTKEQENVMGKQTAAIRGLYNAGVGFMYTAAGQFAPDHLGVTQFYGAAAEASSENEAAQLAAQQMGAVHAVLANYPQARLRHADTDRVLWLWQFLQTAKHGLALVGHPDPRAGSKGQSGDGTLNANADLAQEQNEILMRGLAKLRENYAFVVTAEHLSRKSINKALVKMAHEASLAASRQKGSVNISFGMSLPWMASVGQSRASATGVGHSRGESTGEGATHGKTWGESHGTADGESYTYSKGRSESWGTGRTVSHGWGTSETHSEGWGTSDSRSHSVGVGTTTSESWGTSHGVGSGWSNAHTDSQSSGHGASQAQGWGTTQSSSDTTSQSTTNSHGTSVSNSVAHSTSDSVSSAVGSSWAHGTSSGVSQGASSGVSHGTSSGTSHGISAGESSGGGTSWSDTTSQGSSATASVGHSSSESAGVSANAGVSGGMNVSGKVFGPTVGANAGVSAGVGVNYSQGSSDSTGMAIGSNSGSSHTTGGSSFGSTSSGENWGTSSGESFGTSEGVSHGTSFGTSDNVGGSVMHGTSHTEGTTVGQTTGESWGTAVSQGTAHSEGVANSVSGSQGTSQNWALGSADSRGVSGSTSDSTSHSVGVAHSTSESWGEAYGKSHNWGVARGTSENWGVAESESHAVGVSEGEAWGKSHTDSHSTSAGESVGQSFSRSQSQADSAARNAALGFSGGFSSGIIPSVSVGQAWQTENDVAIQLTNALRAYEYMLKQGAEEGGFMVDAMLLTASPVGETAAAALVPQAFHGTNTPEPVSTIPLGDALRDVVPYLQAFRPTIELNDYATFFDGLVRRRYGTFGLAQHLAAYTAPGQFSEGTAITIQEKLPPLAFYPNIKGDVLLGSQYSPETGDLTPVPLKIEHGRMFHTAFCADTGYGKSVAAQRLVMETTVKWHYRTVVLDFGAGWRSLLNVPELAGHVDVRQLTPGAVRPLRWNPLQIGAHIPPETQWRAFGDIFGAISQMGTKRQGPELRECLKRIYIRAGVMVDDPEVRQSPWGQVVDTTESLLVGRDTATPLDQLTDAQRQQLAVHRSQLVDLADLYAEVQERLAAAPARDQIIRPILEGILFRMNPLIEGAAARQYAKGLDCIDIARLGSPHPTDGWGVTIIEGGAMLDNFCKAFLLGWLAWHLYTECVQVRVKRASSTMQKVHLVFEEANKILAGANSGGGGDGEQSAGEFTAEQFAAMWRDSRKYDIYLSLLTQSPALIPPGIMSSCNNLVVGQLKNAKDRDLAVAAFARSEKGLHDEDWRRFLARLPIAQAVVKLGYSFDMGDVEPVLVRPAMLDCIEPTDEEIGQQLGVLHV